MLTPKQTQYLLETLCVDYGFCLAPDEHHRLTQNPPDGVSAFTDAVFTAEGLNPQHADRHLYRQIRECVAKAFRNDDTDDV